MSYDLELEILECWNIISDMKLLLENEARKETIYGVLDLFELKFALLFSTFETFIKDYWSFKRKSEVIAIDSPALWPLGHGRVLHAASVDEKSGTGVLTLRALPDGFSGEPGSDTTLDLWNEIEGAPQTMITFSNTKSISDMMLTLQRLQYKMHCAAESDD